MSSLVDSTTIWSPLILCFIFYLLFFCHIFIVNFSEPEILGDDALYIGIAANHPGGGLGLNMEIDDGCEANPTEILAFEKDFYDASIHSSSSDQAPPPSVIGYSANMGSNPFAFVGDFVYQVILIVGI